MAIKEKVDFDQFNVIDGEQGYREAAKQLVKAAGTPESKGQEHISGDWAVCDKLTDQCADPEVGSKPTFLHDAYKKA